MFSNSSKSEAVVWVFLRLLPRFRSLVRPRLLSIPTASHLRNSSTFRINLSTSTTSHRLTPRRHATSPSASLHSTRLLMRPSIRSRMTHRPLNKTLPANPMLLGAHRWILANSLLSNPTNSNSSSISNIKSILILISSSKAPCKDTLNNSYFNKGKGRCRGRDKVKDRESLLFCTIRLPI